MKRVTNILAVLSLAVLCFVASAHAQYRGQSADIPFVFTVGNLSFPAGHYDFVRTGFGLYEVRNADGHRVMVMTSAPIEPDGRSEKSTLRFALVDGRHILLQIWNGYALNGNEFQHLNTAMEPSKLRSYR